VELVAWLVRYHLVMSDIAQRRDIGDARTVAQFAQLVGGLERLRLLLVLTVADIRAVGPGVWNAWKGQLLRDLYRATEAVLRGGRADEDSVASRLSEQAAQAREAAVAALGEAGAAQRAWLDALEDAYWLTVTQDDALWHLKEAAAPGPVRVAARTLEEAGVTQLMVHAPDRPGLFAALARALAEAGADVADARAHTLKDGSAFDVFSVLNTQGEPFGAAEAGRMASLLERVEAAARGEGVASRSAGRPAPVARRLAAFSVAPWVRIDSDGSAASSIVEVSGRDRPGLLADLAEAIAGAGLSIVSAHIDGFGERAADVFYVQTLTGEKLRAPERVSALRAELEAVLRKEEPDAPTSPARVPLAVAPASTAR